MKKVELSKYKDLFDGYTELRIQENRNSGVTMLNGNIVANSSSSQSGVSVRVSKNGNWGFSSHPEISGSSIKSCITSATKNAEFLGLKQGKGDITFDSKPGEGTWCFFTEKPKKSQEDKIGFIKKLDEYIVNKYPDLTGRTFVLRSQEMEKQIVTSDGSDFHYMNPRTLIICVMNMSSDGDNVELYEIFGGQGEFEDNFDRPEDLFSHLDSLYSELQDKMSAEEVVAGTHEVILDPKLAGILAHEAIGHTTEADFVLGGSVAADLMDEVVASPLISLVDFAHHFEDELCPMPQFIDDEGVIAEDRVIIDRGKLVGYMHNRESAKELNMSLTGNARAYEFTDEPLIRMRNTAILPGESKLSEMISSVKKGYYLMATNNGQADATAEFMFGITKGYEIIDGKLGKAIKDTTISGNAFDVLKSVTMVSDDLFWDCAGMCGKKQPIPVGMGGPAIKCRVNMGGTK